MRTITRLALAAGLALGVAASCGTSTTSTQTVAHVTTASGATR